MLIENSLMLEDDIGRGGADPVAVRLRLIGQMEAWTLNSESVLPVGRKTKALLAIIALSAPRPVLRSRLAEMLWSRRPEEQARASLRQEIHRLLDTLSPAGVDVLTVTREHLALRPGVVWVDVEEVLRATAARPQSLALLNGELLEELNGVDPAFDTWLLGERERLRDRARAVAEALLREQVQPEAMILAADQLLGIDRAHEGAWRALMRAHAERGERGMAIQAFERCRTVLASMLDATPSPETQQLMAEIRSGRAASGRSNLPAPPLPDSSRMEPWPSAQRGGARVGVLPLQLVGATDEVSHLALGLAEEITAALARFRWLFLVSSSSLAQFAQTTRDEADARRTFGLDFILDGSIQKSGDRLRITLRLMDLRDGNQVVWARRFDRQSDDLLSLQDEVAAEVVAQVDPEILLIESRRAARRPPGDATAYDLALRAIPLLGRHERSTFQQAGELLAKAVSLEPDYAASHAWYALWHVLMVSQGWASNPLDTWREAHRLAERAMALDPQDARALTIAGHVRAFLHHRVRGALSLHERALSLNPNLAMAWAFSAIADTLVGDWEAAEAKLRRYKQLSPMDPHAFLFDTASVVAALQKRDYEDAVAKARVISELNPAYAEICKPYLAALGHLGRLQEAAIVRRRLLAGEQDFTIARFLETTALERQEDREHMAEGLRLAGVAEA